MTKDSTSKKAKGTKKGTRAARKPTRYEQAAAHVERFMRDPATPPIIRDALASFLLEAGDATDPEGQPIIDDGSYKLSGEGGRESLARFLSLAARRKLFAARDLTIHDPSANADLKSTYRRQAETLAAELDRRKADDQHALVALRVLDDSLHARHGIAAGQAVLVRRFEGRQTEDELSELVGRLVLVRWKHHDGDESLIVRRLLGWSAKNGNVIFEREPGDRKNRALDDGIKPSAAVIVGPVVAAAHVSPVWTTTKGSEGQFYNHSEAQPFALACVTTTIRGALGDYFGQIE